MLKADAARCLDLVSLAFACTVLLGACGGDNSSLCSLWVQADARLADVDGKRALGDDVQSSARE